MFELLATIRKPAAWLAGLFTLLALSACDTAGLMPAGPAVSGGTVQVALLLPGADNPTTATGLPAMAAAPAATAQPGAAADTASPGLSADAYLARNLENAARLAIADLNGVQVNLKVYHTGSDPAQAAAAATQAVNEGAKIILGPLYAEAANAAGRAVAGRGVNVLAFSNNAAIAGGNVFILGSTFGNTANRLVTYAMASGTTSFLVVHGNDIQGNTGSSAIANAISANGGTMLGDQGYPLTQAAILGAARGIADAVKSSGAQAVFLTGSINSDLPIIATALPERGVDPATTRYIGLTRWDAAPQALALPGLQGGIFAEPDPQMTSLFSSRYTTAYGSAPHPLASLAYDGIAAIGALVASGMSDPLGRAALTQPQGFQGTAGIFRFLPDGTNERGLAVAQVQNNQVVIVDPAPRSFVGLIN